MTVQLGTLLTDLAGLEEVYGLVKDTQHLLGTMSTLTQLSGDASFVQLGISVCPWHAATTEDFAQLAIASMDQRVAQMERCVEEMKGRMDRIEQRIEKLEEQQLRACLDGGEDREMRGRTDERGTTTPEEES